MMIVCGVDEAGRGPVIGPLVLACAVFDEAGAEKLRELKVRDSKRLTVKRREHLEPLIKELALDWRIMHVLPKEIDDMRSLMSLNRIEAHRTAKMLLLLKQVPDRIVVDAADVVAENYGKMVSEMMCAMDSSYVVPELLSEHRADDNHVEVSAASVLAKVERDRAIAKLRDEHGDFGSGYPHDDLTRAFLRDLLLCGDGTLPEWVRCSWKTVDNCRQTGIGDF